MPLPLLLVPMREQRIDTRRGQTPGRIYLSRTLRRSPSYQSKATASCDDPDDLDDPSDSVDIETRHTLAGDVDTDVKAEARMNEEV